MWRGTGMQGLPSRLLLDEMAAAKDVDTALADALKVPCSPLSALLLLPHLIRCYMIAEPGLPRNKSPWHLLAGTHHMLCNLHPVKLQSIAVRTLPQVVR